MQSFRFVPEDSRMLGRVFKSGHTGVSSRSAAKPLSIIVIISI